MDYKPLDILYCSLSSAIFRKRPYCESWFGASCSVYLTEALGKVKDRQANAFGVLVIEAPVHWRIVSKLGNVVNTTILWINRIGQKLRVWKASAYWCLRKSAHLDKLLEWQWAPKRDKNMHGADPGQERVSLYMYVSFMRSYKTRLMRDRSIMRKLANMTFDAIFDLPTSAVFSLICL